MNILVSLTGKTITVDADPADTVCNIKNKIQDLEGREPNALQLNLRFRYLQMFGPEHISGSVWVPLPYRTII
jgi:hypothetical protein